MNRYIIPVVIFALLVGMLFVGLGHDNQKFTSAFQNKTAPDFSIPDLFDADGKKRTINRSLFNGKIVVLNFWASWCSACYTEHPILMKLSKDKRITMVGIAYKDETKPARAMLNKLGNPFKYTGLDQQGDAGIEYGVSKVPETFIIDKAGVVRYKHLGPISWKELNNTITPLIKKLSTR